MGETLVTIAGRAAPVYRSPNRSHFTELNLLGMDFFKHYNVTQWNDFDKLRAKLYIGGEWEMVRKSKL